jgi:tRNA modification GTPase
MSLDAAGALAGASDTIVAEATAHGRGALAVIRLSGPLAHEIARRIVVKWPDSPRVATRSALRDAAGEPLDEAVVIRYDAPASFTGEDAAELSTHGGSTVPATIVAALIAAGARQAAPGEFTRRAVFNGKMDLLQAEAVADLVSATSRAAQRLALSQLDGGLSRRLLDLRAKILGLEALIAYDIDFPEEDDGPIPRERIAAALADVLLGLDTLLVTAETGELVREGALVVLAGVPNAGKSSLFNALLGRRRAIVTDLPGTTRDAIEAVIDTDRMPLRLVDTAGLRETRDEVERLGVDVSYDYLSRAAVVLACGATGSEIDQAVAACAGKTQATIVRTQTKADIADSRVPGAIAVSSVNGSGLDPLLRHITAALGDSAIEPDAPVLTRARHRRQVAKAREELGLFRDAWNGGEIPAVVSAVHLRAATASLEELIGRVDVESILDEVFSRFCVGK